MGFLKGLWAGIWANKWYLALTMALTVAFVGLFFAFSGPSGPSKEKEVAAYNASQAQAQDKRLAEFNAVEQREAKYGYTPPEVTWGDSLGYKWRWVKNATYSGAATVGKLIATFVFHFLLWAIPFIIMIIFPGFALGAAEMFVEGVVLILAGAVLLLGNWVGELGVSHWVWLCLVVPGAVLMVSSFLTKEGLWKVLVLFGMQVLMTMFTLFGWIDTAMSALIHGSLLALAIVAFVVYCFMRNDDKGGSAAGTAAHA